MNDTTQVIALSGIGKVYRTDELETHALDGIDLAIAQGEYVSISGPSGCGKTTLLSIMGLLDSASTGTYALSGRNVGTLNRATRARIRNAEIGFVFQAFNLIGNLTVQENVALPLTYRDDVGTTDRRHRVEEALERVGMAHRTRHYPAQLSGGQQQRVAVARALVCKPVVLLADEPTGNLDSGSGEAVMGLLDDLHRDGATICMVTHDVRYAKLAQRTVYMFDGRIVNEDTFDRLRREDAQRLDDLIGSRIGITSAMDL